MGLVDHADIQGLAAFGYGKLPEARYLLAGIRDARAARMWLGSAKISTAQRQERPPDTALQLGFTAAGLRALGVSKAIVDGFAPEYVSGLVGDSSRSRRLGDVGANDPACWQWGGPANVPDVIFMLFAKSNIDAVTAGLQNSAWQQGFELLHSLSTSDMHGFEPFGFRDGLSQPKINWDGSASSASDRIDYSNEVALGEFVLGYINEYGKYTDRPLLDYKLDPFGDLPSAEDFPDKKDLGRNGAYLVLRQLEQDTRGFWGFLEQASAGDPQVREQLAAAMVGRERSGEPLMPPAARTIAGEEDKPGSPRNSFVYDSDPHGVACPFGAHIRRANPRNADLYRRTTFPLSQLAQRLGIPRVGLHDDLIASTRYHRILRRGREYGKWLDPADAVNPGPADEEPRGLHFACLSANISRQFEFVQNAWLMSTRFNGVPVENDPLLGNGLAENGAALDGAFSTPQSAGLRRVIKGMPQFIRVRGGAYFFMPGLSALRFMSRGVIE